MGGISHELIKIGCVQLAIDADDPNIVEDENFLQITMGTGFEKEQNCWFGVEMSNLSVKDLIKVRDRLDEIIELYSDEDDFFTVKKIILINGAFNSINHIKIVVDHNPYTCIAFSPKHQIHTNNGLKFVEDIKVGDLIIKNDVDQKDISYRSKK